MQVLRYSFFVLIAGAVFWACGGENTTFPAGTGGTQGTGASAADGGNGAGGSGTAGNGSGGTSSGGSGQGGAGGSSMACTWASDDNPCGDGFYCSAASCGQGTCEAIPANDDTMKAVVCGCDGVQYWNAHTAAAHGASVAKDGRCDGDAATCAGVSGSLCRQDLHCGQLAAYPAPCTLDGICWGMPDACPYTAPTTGFYRPCMSSGGDNSCRGECEAIKADGAFDEDLTCGP